jgi:hypothetical protein
MATAPTAISDKQLEAEIQTLHGEGTRIKKKIDDDTRALQAASAERERIIDGIARGTVKESEAPANKAEIEGLQIRIEGNNRLLSRNSARVNDFAQEYARRQAAAAREAREKEFAELVRRGQNAAIEIFELMTLLAAEKVPTFDAIRKKLGSDFADIGGEAAAIRLREMLFKYPGPNDAVHDPNVHLRRLFDQGWVMAGVPGDSYKPFRSSNGGYSAVPGGELSLTVYSLRPKK